jgi:hypothetical protein
VVTIPRRGLRAVGKTGLCRDQRPLDLDRKLDQHKMALMIEIVFPAFVHNPEEILFGGFLVGDDLIDLSRDERGFVTRIVNA